MTTLITQPSNKQQHHGEPIAAMAAWLWRINSSHPRVPLQKGSFEVAVKGFLLKLIIGRRKK
jgi:hypothetical protein